MAWRIDVSMIRGEIDNSQKGVVRGRIWFAGLPLPVLLELTGNACADLAGCCLEFTNPRSPVPMRTNAVFATEQRGRVGDVAASRKVRVFDVPTAEAFAMLDRGEQAPEHLANSLYLEWFSAGNGRVVIESTGFLIEISPPAWRLMPADEQQRQADLAAGWSDFVGRLNAAIVHQERYAKDPEAEWDEHDYERFLRQSDARTDKYGDSDAAHERIAREMGWERELTEEEATAEQQHIDEINAAFEATLDEPPDPPDPLREGIDWIRTDDGDIRHPLEHHCFEAAIRFHRECEVLGHGESTDADLAQFIGEFQITVAKLAGALGGLAEGREARDAAFTVACLKRALDHLHKAQAGLEAVATKPHWPARLVANARRELLEIREEILRLMQELRDDR